MLESETYWLHTMRTINPILLFIDSTQLLFCSPCKHFWWVPCYASDRTYVRAFKQIALSSFTKTLFNLCFFTEVGSLNFISIGKWIFFSCLVFCSFFCAIIYFPAVFFHYIFVPAVCVCVDCRMPGNVFMFQAKVFEKSFRLLFLLRTQNCKTTNLWQHSSLMVAVMVLVLPPTLVVNWALRETEGKWVHEMSIAIGLFRNSNIYCVCSSVQCAHHELVSQWRSCICLSSTLQCSEIVQRIRKTSIWLWTKINISKVYFSSAFGPNSCWFIKHVWIKGSRQHFESFWYVDWWIDRSIENLRLLWKWLLFLFSEFFGQTNKNHTLRHNQQQLDTAVSNINGSSIFIDLIAG